VTRAAKRLLAVAAALVLLAPASFAADAEKDKLVRELIATTGVDRVGGQIMDALIQQFRQVYTSVPDDYWKSLRATVKEEELAAQIAPLYAARFSVAELNEVLAFYRSPVGKKVVATTPEIAQQSVKLEQAWGREQTGKLLEKLKADGYKPAGK
jgi:hypothetical protein